MSDNYNNPGRSELPPENLAGDRTHLPAGHALPGGPDDGVEPVRTVRIDDDATIERGTGYAATRIEDSAHLLPEHAGPGQPGQIAATDDPDMARAEIEQTRARMSSTIDEIEEVLLRKKEKIQERMDVMAPVKQQARDRPLVLFGGVFAAGLVLGFLTGGDDDDAEMKELLKAAAAGGGGTALAGGGEWEQEDRKGWKSRAKEWEKQSRRLMKEVERQEDEIRMLRGQLDAQSYTPGQGDFEFEYEDEERGGGWRSAVAGALTGVVSGLFRRGGGEEVDVEFRPDPALEGRGYEEAGYQGYGEYGRVYDEAAFGDGSPALDGYDNDLYPESGYDNDRYPGNQLPG